MTQSIKTALKIQQKAAETAKPASKKGLRIVKKAKDKK
jgi:hypothetical protein